MSDAPFIPVVPPFAYHVLLGQLDILVHGSGEGALSDPTPRQVALFHEAIAKSPEEWQAYVADWLADAAEKYRIQGEGAGGFTFGSHDLSRRHQDLLARLGHPLITGSMITYDHFAGSPSTHQHLHPMVAAYINQAVPTENFSSTTDPGEFPLGRLILDLPRDQKVLVVRAIVERFRWFGSAARAEFGTFLLRRRMDSNRNLALCTLLHGLLRSRLPLLSPDIENLFSLKMVNRLAIGALEHYIESHPLPEALRSQIERLRTHLAEPRYAWPGHSRPPTRETAELLERIAAILESRSGAPSPEPAPLRDGEPWVAAAKRDTQPLSFAQRQKWNALLIHLQSVKASKPTDKWLKRASALADAFGRDILRRYILAWLPIAAGQQQMFATDSETVLKGLAWAAAIFPGQEVAAVLGDLGEACWKKIPGHGPCSKRVGNAVLCSLSFMATNPAVAQLTRINSRLRHASARKLADRAMQRVAASTGLTREDLEEIAVPTFSLDAVGAHTRRIGNFQCTLSLTPQFDAITTITDAAGKLRKSIPAELKTDPDFKSFHKIHRHLRALLPAQKFRLESLFRLPERSWSLADWRTRYLDHPILSHLARRLIWRFAGHDAPAAAMPRDGELLTAAGTPLPAPPSTARVSLWHPCTATADEVRAWREFLEGHQITQPFKQAHREIYLLTDAERDTRHYSNRFAAHILRQHQFTALCAARGWSYHLQGGWDGGGGGIPTLDLPALNLKAQFWVEPIGVDEPAATSATGVSLNISTDQVRFYHRESLAVLELTTIPPQVFSEILRDVDLFVGVCSVGNDPTWADGGPQGLGRDYWESFSSGALSETAKTRKSLLESLIPRLAIASQCSLTDRFLCVKGSFRSYKIHLGSGNILMEPNDQYLCIVPDRSPNFAGKNLYLPFEGDATLSLILSKAFLLAADKKITDPSITRQIQAG